MLPRNAISNVFSGAHGAPLRLGISDAYLQRLTGQVWTVYIDDKSFHSYPVNMIINYNIYGDRSLYHPETAYSLMGAAYAPLRPEFRNVEYPVREQAEAVLLTTGGSDRYDLAGQILRAVPKELAVVFHVVSGIFNPHYDALCRMALADFALVCWYNRF